MTTEVIFTRARSAADMIERLIQPACISIDAAIYRFNSPRFARLLDTAARRGIRVRLILDHNKYAESLSTRQLLGSYRMPLRLLYGRRGPGSKMHHKFAVVDDRLVLTGSYNWTLESEAENYENLLILRAPREIGAYRKEFDALWEAATEVGGAEDAGCS